MNSNSSVSIREINDGMSNMIIHDANNNDSIIKGIRRRLVVLRKARKELFSNSDANPDITNDNDLKEILEFEENEGIIRRAIERYTKELADLEGQTTSKINAKDARNGNHFTKYQLSDAELHDSKSYISSPAENAAQIVIKHTDPNIIKFKTLRGTEIWMNTVQLNYKFNDTLDMLEPFPDWFEKLEQFLNFYSLDEVTKLCAGTTISEVEHQFLTGLIKEKLTVRKLLDILLI
ncbi:hypothetical protein TPHA_0C01870 [Tetrapisispora phaffii CBS 4417]|uniref:Uncharacterized protein n=1 Tax=Tetrapisispora phaffii (strain ATCC 24235 / CBS 4417 / NBRC 1672 / NRRL Y-8282 / UCD 70-5) TaxID=1071381 RepID=G8BRG7_TETPH|nr:hypothetical protein TPHA_0C01870 [Tetrapisispora phaffii CBS 4417]CCE62343.1 hypothetical protein TPHA_0C01870 [Tetrapisispora phaffii CBS 4417]